MPEIVNISDEGKICVIDSGLDVALEVDGDAIVNGVLTIQGLLGPLPDDAIGLLRHDADGTVIGGQMTIAELNTYLSDGPIGDSLDDAYRLGNAITVDNQALLFTTPDESDNAVMQLVQDDVTHHSNALNIIRNSSPSNDLPGTDAFSIYLTGSDNQTIWSDKTLTFGHTTSGNGEASVRAAGTGGGELTLVARDSTGDFSSGLRLTSGAAMSRAVLDGGMNLFFRDDHSTWTNSPDGIALSQNAQEWDDVRTLIGGEGSLFSAILAGSAGNGGDVVGPASSTNSAIALFDGATGKRIKNSAMIIDDDGGLDIGTSEVRSGDKLVLRYDDHTLTIGRDTGEYTDDIDIEAKIRTVFSIDDSEIAEFNVDSLSMKSHHVDQIKTATFDDWPSITVDGGVVNVAFSSYQKANLDLNDVSNVTVNLQVPRGPGNFMLILKQGETTVTTTVNWITEGAHALDLPVGGLSINQDIGSRTALGIYFDGTRWGAIATPMTQALSV